MKLNNWYERIVFYYIVCTYLVYFTGLQILCAPLIGFSFAYITLVKWYKRELSIPLIIWLWVGSSLILLGTIVGSHIQMELGMTTMVKTMVVNWGRGWALLPLFMLASCLPIRPQVVYRAVSVLCLMSFIAIPLFFIGGLLHIPSYTSPLYYLLQGGESPFVVVLGFGAEEGLSGGGLRFQLFAPWAPALGMIACCFFFLCREERVLWLRYASMAGAALMVAASVSRLGVVALPVSSFLVWYVGRVKQPVLQITSAFAVLIGGLFFPLAGKALDQFKNNVDSLRSTSASSNLVREKLYGIAVYRWYNEAFWWGHGLTEEGPKMVHHMPIGTHHTWANLLFTKGIIGCFTIFLIFLWSFIELLIKTISGSKVSRAALGVVLVWFAYSFGENIETLAYLYWPAILIVGSAFNSSIIRSSNGNEFSQTLTSKSLP